MQVGDKVKFAEPQNDQERAARFILIEINGDRGIMQLVCDLPIAPSTLVRLIDVIEADPGPFG